MNALEIQFAGYQPVQILDLADTDVFEGIDAVEALQIIHDTMMGDADADGWYHGETRLGESFQVRPLHVMS